MKNAPTHLNIIVSPHLDDAVFSLGGFIQTEPANTKVITVFSGTPAEPLSGFWDRRCGFNNSTEAMGTRIHEDTKALTFLGMEEEDIIHLSYLDEQYRAKGKERISDDELKKQIAGSIEMLIKKYPAGLVRVFAPLMSAHADHRIVRDAVMELSTQGTAAEIYVYQDIPYIFTAYLKKKITHPFLSASQVLALLKPRGSAFVTVLPYNKSRYDKKLGAIAMYQSQFRPKISQLSLVKKAVRFLSKAQTESGAIYSEIVYKITP